MYINVNKSKYINLVFKGFDMVYDIKYYNVDCVVDKRLFRKGANVYLSWVDESLSWES